MTLNLQPGGSWGNLASALRKSIVDICKSPALIDLDMQWAPLALAGVCSPTLKRLRLFHPSLGPAADINPVPRPFDIVLEELELWSALDGVAQFFFDPSNQISLNDLRELEVVAYSSKYHSHVQLLLDQCRRSLETFYFRPGGQIASSLSTSPLSCPVWLIM